MYFFGNGKAEGKGGLKELLGGKGAGLAEMTNLGIPVPPGFTISTEACVEYIRRRRKYPPGLWDTVLKCMTRLEKSMNMGFGDSSNPLLVSVRSGARASMPGMMDTVLNLGLNDQTVQGLIKKTRNERFGFDAYRRFIAMFSTIVTGMKREVFEECLRAKKISLRCTHDIDLDACALRELINEFKVLVHRHTDHDFPQDPIDQLRMGINAVFESWNGDRAIAYRRIYKIPDAWGTAVNVMAMVFGNMGDNCATGVVFTRNPSDGSNDIYGEYLINAQGEDVVAGTRTPENLLSMNKTMSKIFQELKKIFSKLENKYKDMQDIEFTVENNKLWMLQTRSGKRTAKAAIKIAVDMVQEKLISNKEAILRIDPNTLDTLLHPTLDEKAEKKIIASGLPASPGAASGKVTFSADEAEKLKEQMQDTILVRIETSPEDINGMHAAKGILTARGGMTSHAAVVARGMGKPCVSGSSKIKIDYEKKEFKSGERIIKEGDIITIDGGSGKVMLGKVPTVKPDISGDFSKVMVWADKIRKLKVRTNSETPADTKIARDFGAEGIGLCRTEHMFFDEKRIVSVRQMILSKTLEDRRSALAKILPYQKNDFFEIFKIMSGLPVTVRLLDPPLHEFLPKTDNDISNVAKELNMSNNDIKARVVELHEQNPMLGHRGCRLGISFPEIYQMQCTAIFEALVECKNKKIKSVIPEIMIPLVSTAAEIQILKNLVDKIAAEIQKKHSLKIKYFVGTMIELPRAAIRAKEIAKYADFFSFGTNDLTQTTFGISRDDSGKFLNDYVENKIFNKDPFVSIDERGVGELIKIATERGRLEKKSLKLGICGEHGGDPASIEFCEKVKLNYVSCSPYRVPIARLSAAQAFLKRKK